MNQSLQQVSRRLGTPGLAAVVTGAVALAVFLFMAKSFAGTLLVPSGTLAKKTDEVRKEKAKQYASTFEARLAQLNGRSLWFIPSAPPPPPPPAKPIEPIKDPGPPPPPSTYGGPSLIAMVNGVVWFSDGKKLAAGEGDSELKVLELHAPWGAVVKWKDVKFTVGLFERDSVVFPAPKEKEKDKTEASDDHKNSEAEAKEPKADPKSDPKADPKADPKSGDPKADPKADPKSDPKAPPPPPPTEPPPQGDDQSQAPIPSPSI